MELNQVTRQLLAQGWRKEQTPPGMRPWNDFYGGWEYSGQRLAEMTFETPCGLLVEGSTFCTGHMSYGGIEWTAENDCPTICCPKFLAQPCPLRNPALPKGMDHRSGVIQQCACHRTDRPYTYQGSVNQVQDQLEKEMELLWQQFKAQRSGRVCRNHAEFNRTTKVWSIHYDPTMCASICFYQDFCPILNKPLEQKKGNVFYDVRSTWTEPAQGLFPPEQKQTVEKGVKLLQKPVSLTICQAIVDYGLHNVRWILKTNWSWKSFLDPSLVMEAVNFRAVRKDTRDLLQDLQDVAEGIQVTHAADSLKAAKTQKKACKEVALAARTRRMERLILQKGWDALEHYQKAQAEKLLDDDRIKALLKQREDKAEQVSLF